jgi:hypothetical protein
MKEKLKTYRICYRMECWVKATSEDEAMEKYGDGEVEGRDYVEFLSIEHFDEEEEVG